MVPKSILKKGGGESARVAVSISYPTNEIEIGSSVFLDWEDEGPNELRVSVVVPEVESVSTVAGDLVTVPVKKVA
ncbi:hypothetical protein PI124_g13928 [Phytophthora idaei]|nr:hypothetical protein PI126_g11111 [Phytophthora idaei]KAG3241197.1 hypothetical protein PI124_g13928 [Phytophthora idaei]